MGRRLPRGQLELLAARGMIAGPETVRRASGAARANCPQFASQRFIHASTVAYHITEFCGLSTQWFSSGK